MTFRLPRLPRHVAFTDPKTGFPTLEGQRWWQSVVESVEAEFGALEAAQAAVATASTALTTAETADTKAETAQATAETADSKAEAAQAAVDALDIPPSGSRTVTTNDNITDADYLILADASGGAITLTLPLAAAAGGPFLVRKIDATANAVNVARSGSDSINGGAGPIAITTAYEQRSVASDGINAWYVS